MKVKERFGFIFAKNIAELEDKNQRRAFVIWNAAFLLLSALAITAVSLTLAIGNSSPLLFLGYFRNPLIFLLNFVPVLILQLLLYTAFNRQWLAFLLSSFVLAAGSIGNYFKFQLRYEPFVFSDFSSIAAGLEIAGEYSLKLNSRIIMLVAAMAAGTLFLLFFARGRMGGKRRIICAVLALASVWPLWSFVYSNPKIYNEKTDNSDEVIAVWAQQVYISKGFVYPFIYSIGQAKTTAPYGYDAKAAAEIIGGYSDADIPENKKVNIMLFQMESFCDLRSYGLENVDESTYAMIDKLAEESVSGLLVPNVMGGGTINTEQSILVGSYGQLECKKAAPSHVRYLNSQGYFTTGGHPNRCDYYNRVNANSYLGFQEYLFAENHYGDLTGGKWDCDEVFIPESFRLFREKIQQGEKVFSFNISLQNHSPYEASSLEYGQVLWQGEGVSEKAFNMINNYLGSAKMSQQLLANELELLRDFDEPVVCLLYGDHKPYFGMEIYAEAGIQFDESSAQGLVDYYSTPYYIWANNAAKEILGNDFSSNGPMISPGYMMNVLFEQLGWEGSAYMQFLGDVMERLPVVSTNQVYMLDGELKLSLGEDKGLLSKYENVQYYLNNSFKK